MLYDGLVKDFTEKFMNSMSPENNHLIEIRDHGRKEYPLLGGYASQTRHVYPPGESAKLFMLLCTSHFLRNVELVTIINIIGGEGIEENPLLVQQTVVDILKKTEIKRVRYADGSRPFFIQVFQTMVDKFPEVVCTTTTNLNGLQFWQLVETSDEQNPPAQPK